MTDYVARRTSEGLANVGAGDDVTAGVKRPGDSDL